MRGVLSVIRSGREGIFQLSGPQGLMLQLGFLMLTFLVFRYS